ncbi:hypothetical protein ACOMHN_038159 [Nucella lapillus]
MYQNAIFELELDQTVPSSAGEFLTSFNSECLSPFDSSCFPSDMDTCKASPDYISEERAYGRRGPPSYEETLSSFFLEEGFGPRSPSASRVPDVAGSDAASASSSTLLDDIMECIQLDKGPHLASPGTPESGECRQTPSPALSDIPTHLTTTVFTAGYELKWLIKNEKESV